MESKEALTWAGLAVSGAHLASAGPPGIPAFHQAFVRSPRGAQRPHRCQPAPPPLFPGSHLEAPGRARPTGVKSGIWAANIWPRSCPPRLGCPRYAEGSRSKRAFLRVETPRRLGLLERQIFRWPGQVKAEKSVCAAGEASRKHYTQWTTLCPQSDCSVPEGEVNDP
ncbi:uncharacterized protein LOC111550740 [Piliocolobus tephrosceles]|uniref:uncharacterized protein LOC111550740 n=1 Tax=Piliocolobus tephrosceles TaxID=591936 RepID=UPI000C2A4E34|nr:uncharacterized protein LOC111550740 [Piliocolobus tephrosceles]